MDEQTKHTVASNLTIAYFSCQERPSANSDMSKKELERNPRISESEVLAVYSHFVAKLSSDSKPPESSDK